MTPIVVAATLWGSRWRGKTVQCRTDNAAVVAIVNSGRSKRSDIAMHLMRSLFFIMAKFDPTLWGSRWRGKTVQCRTDNAAVVAIVNSGRSKRSDIAMHLMRSLFFIMAKFDLTIFATHVPGRFGFVLLERSLVPSPSHSSFCLAAVEKKRL